MCAKFPPSIASAIPLFKVFCLHTIITVTEFINKRKKMATHYMVRIGVDCACTTHLLEEVIHHS